MDSNVRITHGTMLSHNGIPSNANGEFVRLHGTCNGRPAVIGLDKNILSKHSLMIGGTGCGKTTLFFHFIDQIKRRMTDDDVMIIFDSKGDFYEKFRNLHSEKNLVIGNSKQYADISMKWNIFKEILSDHHAGDKGEGYLLTIQEICKSFFAEKMKKSKDPFFSTAACQLLSSVLTSLIRDGMNSLKVRQEMFFNSSIRDWLNSASLDDYMEVLSSYPDLQAVQNYIDPDSGAQGLGVLSEMFTTMKSILVGVFADRGMFSIRDFVREKGGKTLFIEYDLSIGSVLSPVYSLLFDLALKEALGRQEGERGNIYLICDEFRLLPNLQHIDDAVNFGRSLGVKVFAGLQSINQLQEVYGEARGKNIAAGFSSIYAFHANDTETRAFATNLFGKNEYRLQYPLMTGGFKDELRNGNTVEDWDMTNLAVGEAVVGLPFSKPFRFQFNDYKK